jgi:hypothetical protein
VKGHLVTCLNREELQKFETQGYVGVGPFYPDSNASERQVNARLRILWDVIADLKRVQPGDVCFLHTEGNIFGPYIFKMGFRESRTLPQILRSQNLTMQQWWEKRNEFNNINMSEYGYVASIDRPSGCNSNGSGLMNLFLRQSLGIFNGVPPRFMYGDTKKIVKPLLFHEIAQLLEIVEFNGDWTISQNSAYPLDTLDSIILDLSDYGGHLFCEKLLEAWFMENMSHSDQRKEVINAIGNFSFYANSIYTYYTNFLDVIAYDVPAGNILNRCEKCGNIIRHFAENIRIIELKRDRLSDNLDTIQQIRDYMKWAKEVLNPFAKVAGYIVAAGFSKDYDKFIKNNTKDDLYLLQYKIFNGTLRLQEC